VTLLVTGATGFVMSVLVRQWLRDDPTAHVVGLDAAPPDAAAQRYFEPVANRLTLVIADLTQPEQWRAALKQHPIRHIVHGATVTPISRGSAAEVRTEPEAHDPRRIIDINTMGTVALLDWARTLPDLRRFINVSTGGVYKEHGPDRPGEPLPEDGYVMPRLLYGISKLAAELITERYGDLFHMSTVSVRPSSVFGPMDRLTQTRNYRHVPNRIAQLALDGARRVRVNTLDAIGDYVHVEDVARAIIALMAVPRLRYSCYNIASGQTSSIRDIVGWVTEKVPGFAAEVVAPELADVLQDPTLRDGMWGAYDISRICAETSWRPRAPREAMHAYMEWLVAERRANVAIAAGAAE
jgi:UDP-glucose 4-epimerase